MDVLTYIGLFRMCTEQHCKLVKEEAAEAVLSLVHAKVNKVVVKKTKKTDASR